MKKIEDLKAYEVIEKRQIDDIGSMSWLLRHKKTGARIALLSNDDENKVFYIAYRSLRFQGFSGEGSVCGACQGFPEYVS